MNASIPKATLYILDLMGFKRIEATDIEIEFVEHAQYRNAIQVTFTPRGKRKRYQFIEIDQPTLVILENWGHPEFQNDKPSTQSGSIIMTETRFRPFSQEWRDAFDVFLAEYLELSSSRVLGDYRNYKVEENFIVSKPDTSNESLDFDMLSAEPIIADEPILEGAITQALYNEYERNPEARRQCITYYGTRCIVCGFDFEEVYGIIGKGFIHVHHLVPVSAQQGEYEVNPIEDLRPVCPNCHAMLHRKTPPYSIEQLKDFFQRK